MISPCGVCALAATSGIKRTKTKANARVIGSISLISFGNSACALVPRVFSRALDANGVAPKAFLFISELERIVVTAVGFRYGSVETPQVASRLLLQRDHQTPSESVRHLGKSGTVVSLGRKP